METVSPRLTSWIISRSWRLDASEAIKWRTSVRGSAIPVLRKMLIPGSIFPRTSPGVTTLSRHVSF